MPKALEVLRGLPPEEQRAVQSQMRRAQVRAGAALIVDDERDDGLIYIESGALRVSKDEIEFAVVRAGDIVGEMALFAGGRRRADVTVLEDASLLFLDKDAFEVLRLSGNPFAFWIEREALTQESKRLREIDRVISELSHGVVNPWYTPKKSVFDRIRDLFQFTGITREPPPIDATKLLLRSPLFEGSSPDAVEALASRLELRPLEAGEFLCEQGSPGEELYFIARGIVDVLVATSADGSPIRVHKLAQLYEGDAVGLSALADGAPRSASCVAIEPTDVLVLTREDWEQLRLGDDLTGSEVRQAVIRGLTQALDIAAEHVTELILTPTGSLRPPEDVLPKRKGKSPGDDEDSVFLDPQIGALNTGDEYLEPGITRAAAATEIAKR